MEVIRIGSRWVARCTYEQRDIPKSAGFRWDPQSKHWYTESQVVANRLDRPGAADEYRIAAQARATDKQAVLASSQAVSADIDIPIAPGYQYRDYQKAGVWWMHTRPATLLADDMGVGKTAQVIGLINLDQSIASVLIVCPATLRLNWKLELERFLARKMTIGIALKEWPETEIVIVNYDRLRQHSKEIHDRYWDLIALDECHALKDPLSRRSKEIFGVEGTKKTDAVEPVNAYKKVAMSGTPMPNGRPKELWPILHYLDPSQWSKFFYFGREFCGAEQKEIWVKPKGGRATKKMVWDFNGATNLDRLNSKLRQGLMLRRMKQDVIKELPPKIRQLIEIPANGASALVKQELAADEKHRKEIEKLEARVKAAKAAENREQYENAVLALQDHQRVAFAEMAEFRHKTALAALPHCMEHILDSFSEPGKKMVIFAWHRDVIDGILAALTGAGIKAVSLTGDTSMANKQKAIEDFQNDPGVGAFVGNIKAAGVGITLTASDHVVFVEEDWVPSTITQAEDRLWRLGAKKVVLVQHLVFEDSLGAKMVKKCLEKQIVIDATLDRPLDRLDNQVRSV